MEEKSQQVNDIILNILTSLQQKVDEFIETHQETKKQKGKRLKGTLPLVCESFFDSFNSINSLLQKCREGQETVERQQDELIGILDDMKMQQERDEEHERKTFELVKSIKEEKLEPTDSRIQKENEHLFSMFQRKESQLEIVQQNLLLLEQQKKQLELQNAVLKQEIERLTKDNTKSKQEVISLTTDLKECKSELKENKHLLFASESENNTLKQLAKKKDLKERKRKQSESTQMRVYESSESKEGYEETIEEYKQELEKTMEEKQKMSNENQRLYEKNKQLNQSVTEKNEMLRLLRANFLVGIEKEVERITSLQKEETLIQIESLKKKYESVIECFRRAFAPDDRLDKCLGRYKTVTPSR